MNAVIEFLKQEFGASAIPAWVSSILEVSEMWTLCSMPNEQETVERVWGKRFNVKQVKTYAAIIPQVDASWLNKL